SSSSSISSLLSDEEYLLKYLFEDYNPSARPVMRSNQVVEVNLRFSLLQIQELNVRNQILTSTGFLILEWSDERLAWSKNISSLDELVVKGDNIWTPEFAVINGVDSIYGEYSEFQAIIKPNGTIRWEPGGIFKTMCSINIAYYPFDTQSCVMKFGAWSYITTKMNLSTTETSVRRDTYEENGEWEVIRQEFAFEDFPTARYSYIQFSIELKRRHTFYIMNVIVPGLLTSTVLLSLFYCVPSQKVHIGVAALLSFRLFLVNVADTVPRTSDHVPLLGVYLTCTMAITTLAMVATVFVGNLYERKDRPVPKWVKTLLFGHMAKILCMRHHV
ncbi:hypothetical protein HELRODRAFT_131728, partial [Helobdella robusta]|uniref:Neurotransmitter-gated ion-channel ligand-binding domain-containing protein n=1 Tax=Helobdella robusta TaxID=6412 RepID=T1EHW5_HELRO